MGNLIMPKNIGDGDYMVALKIYFDADDWISNEDFKQKLKSEIGDSKYVSTYTKIVQILSYYNFVEWQDITKNQSLRRITKSGKRFYVACQNNDQDMINAELIYAINHTLFGKFNSGAPASDSNVEAPAVFIKAAKVLGYLTYKEFAYIIWRMDNDGISFQGAVDEITDIRSKNLDIKLPDQALKYKDAKPIQTLVKWGFLEKEGSSLDYEESDDRKDDSNGHLDEGEN